ncbi:MAG: hypothetical protein KatS3mg050_0826 [Litorilinea sp.]|nr:MAG: hypothetical protein KatS3mg050_0826 [Litorilinea sp.]
MTDRAPLGADRRIYVLRLWRLADGSGWRGQLYDVKAGVTVAFADDQALLVYLRERLRGPPDATTGPGLR